MDKKNKKHENRVKKLIIICGICGVILSVSTYAWFIGMKTVNVSSFDVKVSAIDSLQLSLDGITWSDTVDINSGNYSAEGENSVNKMNNTNSWGTAGLIPMSSIGEIDAEVSRLKLFEKGSFTQVKGGYRVMTSRVRNTKDYAGEADGYVAFDLFIKNLSGNAYYKDLNNLNEEAIYLTPESAVTVTENKGDGKAGIENSVRIAFAEIGRVEATNTDQATITGITCAGGGDVTGICRTAQIWEPNDTKHVQNAINWYNTNCLTRKSTTTTVTDETGYEGTCKPVANGTAYKTYAIGSDIDWSDNINVYDGDDYNGYAASVADTPTDKKLYAYDYFTDTEKIIQGVNRPAFITLAPNSITKVRVYIYLEGQDVDNYDFASLGKSISVAFGFTKEQLYGSDINYDEENGPKLPENVDEHPNYVAPTEP